MDIDKHYSVHSYCLKQPRHISCRNRYSRCCFSILSSVAIVRDHNVDSFGAGSAHGGDHQQQFHKVFIDGRASRLDDEDLLGSDVVFHLDADLSIVESPNFDAS